MSSIKSYVVGYIFSIALTLGAFGLMVLHNYNHHLFPTHFQLTFGFITLAVVQLLIQLFFFLHVGRGQNRHWNAVALGFALFVVAVVAGGTLWIMSNLRHNMPSNFIGNTITAQNSND
jgi:cytochrome o ubiquinol oxidase operon protein cyoD